MSVGDWSETDLCTYTDVRSRYSRVGELTNESVAADQNTEITAVIALAKIDVGKILDGDLRKYKAYVDYEASDLKDLINNIEVMKEACVARTLERLFEDNAIEPDDYNAVMERKFNKEYKEFYDAGFQLIEFDVDESGAIEQEEEGIPLSKYHFDRV